MATPVSLGTLNNKLSEMFNLDTKTQISPCIISTSSAQNPALSVSQTGGGDLANFITGGSNALVIANNGNVGIGTTTPQTGLDVYGNINATSIQSLNYVGQKTFVFNPTSSTGRYFIGKVTGGALIKFQIHDSGYNHGCGTEAIINLQWGNYTNNAPNITLNAGQNQLYEFYIQGTVNSGISYLWFNEITSSAGNNITYIVKIFSNGIIDLNTNDGLTGSSASLITRGLFNVNGNVGIGTTNPTSDVHIVGGANVFKIVSSTYNYGIEFYNGNIFGPMQDNAMYSAYSNKRWSAMYSVSGVIQTSDEKDKDYVSLVYGLKDVLNIETIKYKWKSQQDLPDTNPSKNYEYYGFKAGNLKGIFPELVYDETDTLQLNYAELMPVLVNAIKDLKSELNAIKAHIGIAL